MEEKKFLLSAGDLKPILSDERNCVASDAVTVDGAPVGFMYREKPDEDIDRDSGWRFLSGKETQEYLDDYDNSAILPLNTLANYDPAIVPYLKLPVGSELEREEDGNTFRPLEE